MEKDEYQVGDSFYVIKGKSKEMAPCKITKIKYVFDTKIPGFNSNSLTAEQINIAFQEGTLIDSEDGFRDAQIKKLEKELGIDIIDYLMKKGKK